jgi:hypothetical protein
LFAPMLLHLLQYILFLSLYVNHMFFPDPKGCKWRYWSQSTKFFLFGALLSHCNISLYWSIELLRLRIGVQGLLVLGSALYFWWIPPRMLIYFDVSLYWSL